MPFADIFMRRTENDLNKIVKIALRASTRVAGKVKARYLEEFRTGNKFKAQEYIVQQYKPILLMALITAHLGGYRRTYLMLKQTPALRKLFEDQVNSLQDKGALILSELSHALSILQKKTFLDLEALQELYETLALKVLNDVSRETEEALETEFKTLLAEGVTTREAVRRLGTKFDELGLSPTAPHKLETVFRTQLQMTFAAGRYQAEQNPDVDEILWGYKYVTVGDDRVRPEHAEMEGVTLPKSDPFWQIWYPPNGWNCRCSAIPIFEQRKAVEAPKYDSEGNLLLPDKGFGFNPGVVYRG